MTNSRTRIDLHAEAIDRSRRRALSTLGATAALFATPAFAQSFPSKPFRLVVPFPAGGPTDIVARPFAQLLTESSSQQVIVDNRGGAGGSIGADVVAKAAPDGYTLLVGTVGTNAINPALYRKLPYDAAKDFTPLGLLASAPVAVVVNPQAPYGNIAELIAAAKKAPGSINFGSAGNGSPGHLTGEMFAKAAGVELKHVPYKGSAPAIGDLLGDQIPLMFDPVQSVLQHIRSGKLRALAVSSTERSAVLPQVPTLNESGLKGFESTAWWALFAPAGLLPAIAAQLSTDTRRIVQLPGFHDRLLEIGVQTPSGPATDFGEFQRAEIAKWGRVVRDAGVTLE
jgi:tripartite-type tricarboxylate transporter receptor subunit TctC